MKYLLPWFDARELKSLNIHDAAPGELGNGFDAQFDYRNPNDAAVLPGSNECSRSFVIAIAHELFHRQEYEASSDGWLAERRAYWFPPGKPPLDQTDPHNYDNDPQEMRAYDFENNQVKPWLDAVLAAERRRYGGH